MRAKELMKNVAKVTVAVATILGAAWAIVTLSHRGESIAVQEAEADIWGIGFGERSKHEKFVGVLQDVGMERPRAYDWNGNRVFFSTMTTSESPKQVLRKFQNEFQRVGLNKKAHYRRPGLDPRTRFDKVASASAAEQEKIGNGFAEVLAWQDDFWTGGLVPSMITNEQVQMVGTETVGDGDDALSVIGKVIDKGHKGPDDAVKAMRYVDAWRQSNGSTRVSAVWSDEELNLAKFGNKERFIDQVSVSTTIPACMGCERLMRFEGKTAERGYVANLYEGRQDTRSTLSFYDQTLRNRGYTSSDVNRVLEEARKMGMMPSDIGEMNVYARGASFVTVSAQPMGQRNTIVQVMEMP